MIKYICLKIKSLLSYKIRFKRNVEFALQNVEKPAILRVFLYLSVIFSLNFRLLSIFLINPSILSSIGSSLGVNVIL